MSTPVPAGSCLSCSDSPLSTTASIAGFLTFVFAVLASIRFCLRAVKSTPSEIIELVESAQNTNQRLRNAWEALDAALIPPDSALLQEMKAALDVNRDSFYRLRSILEKLRFTASHRSNLRARADFLLRGRAYAAYAEKINKNVDDVERMQHQIERLQDAVKFQNWFESITDQLTDLRKDLHELKEASNGPAEEES